MELKEIYNLVSVLSKPKKDVEIDIQQHNLFTKDKITIKDKTNKSIVITQDGKWFKCIYKGAAGNTMKLEVKKALNTKKQWAPYAIINFVDYCFQNEKN